MGVAAGAPCCNIARKEVVVKCKASPRASGKDYAYKDGADGAAKDSPQFGDAAGPGPGSDAVEPIISGRDSAGGTSGVAATPVLPVVVAPRAPTPAPIVAPSAAASSSAATTAANKKQFAFRGRQESVYAVEAHKDPSMFSAEPARGPRSGGISFCLEDGEGFGRKVDRKSTEFPRARDVPATDEDT
mmetsp:Transcript_4073/g.11054  ORF Transcript_4073/g.11054 Transcript_4073/m.11054 type:complete len:187 (-) Transcript_4073:270-830(-)